MKDNIINEMISKAEERLESAEILLKSKQYADSISRSYYAVLDAARTLLVLDKVFPKSHAGVIAQFNLHYIKTGIFPKSFGQLLTRVEKSRTEADYSFEIDFTKDEAQDRLKLAKLFVEKVTEHINFISNNLK